MTAGVPPDEYVDDPFAETVGGSPPAEEPVAYPPPDSEVELLRQILRGQIAIATKLERIAIAVERAPALPSPAATPWQLNQPPTQTVPGAPVQGAPPPPPPQAALPDPTTVPGYGWTCPVHPGQWKVVPAGVSRTSQRPYPAFIACPVQGCNQKPPR